MKINENIPQYCLYAMCALAVLMVIAVFLITYKPNAFNDIVPLCLLMGAFAFGAVGLITSAINIKK